MPLTLQKPLRKYIPYVWILFVLAFGLPEIFVHSDYNEWVNAKSVGKMMAFVVLSFFSAASLGTIPGRILAAALWLAQFSQVMHHQFFQRFYNGGDVSLAFVESADILEAAVGMWRLSLPVLLVSGISLVLLVLAIRLSPVSKKAHVSFAIATLILAAHSVHHAQKSVWKSEPGFQQLAVHNAINSLVTYIVKFAVADPLPTEKFAPYEISSIPVAIKPNIILFIGESMNPHHMNVLGYERNTTPGLAKLMQTWPSQHKIILASGVTTRVSTPMLLTVNREPKNISRYKTRHGQLVSQAKDGGYATALYSTQTLDFMPGVSVMADYDTYVDRAQDSDLSDAAYVDYLRSLTTPAGPTFTILNIRPPHMPYAANIGAGEALYSAEKTGDYNTDTRNEYDDAMRTADAIIADSLNTFISRDPRPTLIVITSDHGETMGENGHFGHNRLNIETAEVPLLVIAANWPKDMPVPGIECVANHYQVGAYLLKVMGYQLDNPNLQDNTYYINGNDLYGNNGKLAYKVAEC